MTIDEALVIIAMNDGETYTVGKGGTFEAKEIETLADLTKRRGLERQSPEMVKAILCVKRNLGGRVIWPHRRVI